MRIVVLASPQRVARKAASLVAAAAQQKPSLALALPTGHTPVPLYEALLALQAADRLDLRRARFFNLDEFAALGWQHPASYHAFLRQHLYAPARISTKQIFGIRGDASDPQAEAARYDRAIARTGGLDLAILGIGANGHIGFNEPAPALDPATHLVTLRAATRRSNAWLFGDCLSAVPTRAITMGVGTILCSRRVLLIATGAAKSRIIARALTGPITTMVPASLLRLHRDLTVILDEAAARKLPVIRASERRT